MKRGGGGVGRAKAPSATWAGSGRGGIGAFPAGEAEDGGGGGGGAAVAGVVLAEGLGVEDAEVEAVGEVGGDADEEALHVVGVALAGGRLGAVDDEEGRRPRLDLRRGWRGEREENPDPGDTSHAFPSPSTRSASPRCPRSPRP